MSNRMSIPLAAVFVAGLVLMTAGAVAASPDRSAGIDVAPVVDGQDVVVEWDRMAAAGVHEVLAQRSAQTVEKLEDAMGRRSGFVPTAIQRTDQGTYETAIEDFEVPALDPAKWLLTYDINEEDFGEYYWSLSQCQSSGEGIQSLWALGAGADGSNQACEDPYPRGARSSALLNLDLSGFDPDSVGQLDLVFDFWLNTRNFQENGIVPDGLFIIVYPDADNLESPTVLEGVTAQQSDRFFSNPLVVDLINACDDYDPETCFNLAGRNSVIEFLFVTQMTEGSRFAGGVFLDNLRLVSDVEPGTVPLDRAIGSSNNRSIIAPGGVVGLPGLDIVPAVSPSR